MAKVSKFFRVAVEGATADGRNIDRKDLVEMAAAYNRSTYAARVNLEHIRGFTPDPPFNAYGDVIALKTEEIDLTVGGKTEKRLALFAQIEPTDELVSINQKKQKLYTSVEIQPNFANTGKAYLVGLAVTDSPASLGTELLEFAAKAKTNPLASRKQDPANLFVASEEFSLELEDAATTGQSESATAWKQIGDFFSGLTKQQAVPAGPVVPAVTAPAQPAVSSEFTQILQGMQLMTAAMQTSSHAYDARLDKLATGLAAVTTRLETEPNKNHTSRPVSTGDNNRPRAEF